MDEDRQKRRPSRYYENYLLTLCMKWEAIRRNSKYAEDFLRHLELKILRLKEVISHIKAGNIKTFLDPIVKGDLGSGLLQNWGIRNFIHPDHSFKKHLFRNGKFLHNPNVAQRLEDLFSNYSVHGEEQYKDLGIELFDEAGKFHSWTDPKTQLKNLGSRSKIHVQINLNAKKAEILFKIEQLIDNYKILRFKNNLEIKPKNKKRFKAAVNLHIFTTYDLVKKASKAGRIDWPTVVQKRFPGDTDSQSSNLVKKAQREYALAVKLIAEVLDT